MIKINLLPPEKRKKKRKVEIAIPKVYPILGVAAFSVIVLFIIAGTVVWRVVEERRLSRLVKQYEELIPLSEQIAEVERGRKILEQKVLSFKRLMGKRMLWAKKLNEIGDNVPPQIWLKSLSVVAQPRVSKGSEELHQVLLLEGSVISQGGEKGLELIGEFMKNLREDKDFFQDFIGDVERGDVRRRASSDIMDFSLKCYFKKE